MTAALVVIGGSAVVGPDLDHSAGKQHHGARLAHGLRGLRHRTPSHRRIRRALFQLQGLENGLVVLVFVLQDHPIDVAVAQQGLGRVEIRGGKTIEHSPPDLLHDLPAVCQLGKRQRSPLAAGVLERIVEARHLHELDRTIQVLGEPQLLEVRDVPEIPENGAHQRIVLDPQIFVTERLEQQQRALARFLKLSCDDLAVGGTGAGYGGHDWRTRPGGMLMRSLPYDTAEFGGPRAGADRL